MKEAPKPSRETYEYLRFRAVDLKEKGWKQKDIAEALGVRDSAVSMWLSSARKDGLDSLRTKKAPGPKPKLTTQQEEELKQLLKEGAESFGFTGDFWTSQRISNVIECVFGVRYHRAHITKLMRRLRFSVQKPVHKAIRKNDELAKNWLKENWPALKKKRKKKDE